MCATTPGPNTSHCRPIAVRRAHFSSVCIPKPQHLVNVTTATSLCLVTLHQRYSFPTYTMRPGRASTTVLPRVLPKPEDSVWRLRKTTGPSCDLRRHSFSFRSQRPSLQSLCWELLASGTVHSNNYHQTLERIVGRCSFCHN